MTFQTLVVEESSQCQDHELTRRVIRTERKSGSCRGWCRGRRESGRERETGGINKGMGSNCKLLTLRLPGNHNKSSASPGAASSFPAFPHKTSGDERRRKGEEVNCSGSHNSVQAEQTQRSISVQFGASSSSQDSRERTLRQGNHQTRERLVISSPKYMDV